MVLEQDIYKVDITILYENNRRYHKIMKPSMLVARLQDGSFKCLKIDIDAALIEQEYKNEIQQPTGLYAELYYVRKPTAWSRKSPIGKYVPITEEVKRKKKE